MNIAKNDVVEIFGKNNKVGPINYFFFHPRPLAVLKGIAGEFPNMFFFRKISEVGYFFLFLATFKLSYLDNPRITTPYIA